MLIHNLGWVKNGSSREKEQSRPCVGRALKRTELHYTAERRLGESRLGAGAGGRNRERERKSESEREDIRVTGKAVSCD